MSKTIFFLTNQFSESLKNSLNIALVATSWRNNVTCRKATRNSHHLQPDWTKRSDTKLLLLPSAAWPIKFEGWN